MEEIIDILDSEGNLTGDTISKKEAHVKGVWHQSAHIWIYNSKGEILLQKRSLQKDSHPGLWDISAAGHIDSGETPLQGAMRELEEELGLKTNKDDFILGGVIRQSVSIPEKNWYNNEFDSLFFYQYDGDISDLTMQETEVDELKFIAYDEFKSNLKDLEIFKTYVQHGEDYYSSLLSFLDNIVGKNS